MFSSQQYLTVGEAAQRKGITPAAVYQAIARGDLTRHRILGRLAVKATEVESWQPLGHRSGRKRGTPVPASIRRRISAAQKKNWQQGRYRKRLKGDAATPES